MSKTSRMLREWLLLQLLGLSAECLLSVSVNLPALHQLVDGRMAGSVRPS